MNGWTAFGYTTLDDTKGYFEIPEQTELVLILEPKTSISDGEWTAIDHWIENGGMLMVVGKEGPVSPGNAALRFQCVLFLETAKELTLQTPWLAAPLNSPVKLRTPKHT